jgi:hypothetical protein
MPDVAQARLSVGEMRVRGRMTAYRLVDVGYGISLDRAAAILGEQTGGRVRPDRARAESIEIRNPPLLARLGSRTIDIDGEPTELQVSVHLFDFGVCSIALSAKTPDFVSWEAFVNFGRAFDDDEELPRVLAEEVAGFVPRITPAIDRPALSPVTEDYTVFRVDSLAGPDGDRPGPVSFPDDAIIPLLSADEPTLSREARSELVSRRFSYYADELVVVTWDNALIVEPDRGDKDVEYVLEFANAQLLELRVYDALLDDELPVLYDRIEARRRRPIPTRRYRPLLAELQTRVADIVEIVERADNGFKVVNDVYLARVYLGALEVFREQAWRRGIDRKLQIFRDTYSMLNAEAQSARGELLEIMIILLFVADIVIGFLH